MFNLYDSTTLQMLSPITFSCKGKVWVSVVNIRKLRVSTLLSQTSQMRPGAIMSFSLSLCPPLCLRHSCISIMCWFKIDWLPKNHLTVPWQIWKKEGLLTLLMYKPIEPKAPRQQSICDMVYSVSAKKPKKRFFAVSACLDCRPLMRQRLVHVQTQLFKNRSQKMPW